MSISKAEIKYRVLKQVQEFKPLNADVKIQIATEVFWENGSDTRDYKKTFIARGIIKTIDKDQPVEWKWVLAEKDSSLLNSAINALGDLDLKFRTVESAPIEREISVGVNSWLTLGLFFKGNSFSYAYVELVKGEERLRANADNLSSIQDIARMMEPAR